jgi:ketosteroid isomerase-like protein
MRYLLLALPLVAAAADRASDREALLAADRALAERTATLGLTDGFLPGLSEQAAYLHPGAPLLRGADKIRALFQTPDSAGKVTWTPAFADVSADGRLGYSYGFLRSPGSRGKYLACWVKDQHGWRIVAYARTRLVPASDSVPPPHRVAFGDPVRGAGDPSELTRADSSFSAMSVAQGAKPAFLAYATDDAISFGGGPGMNEGREAIGAAFNGFPSGAVLTWWPVAAVIAESGDLGCTVGEAKIESLKQYSKYLTIWRRQRDGSWKFVADGGNARPAPSAP